MVPHSTVQKPSVDPRYTYPVDGFAFFMDRSAKPHYRQPIVIDGVILILTAGAGHVFQT
jgi:hypothetical protein